MFSNKLTLWLFGIVVQMSSLPEFANSQGISGSQMASNQSSQANNPQKTGISLEQNQEFDAQTLQAIYSKPRISINNAVWRVLDAELQRQIILGLYGQNAVLNASITLIAARSKAEKFSPMWVCVGEEAWMWEDIQRVVPTSGTVRLAMPNNYRSSFLPSLEIVDFARSLRTRFLTQPTAREILTNLPRFADTDFMLFQSDNAGFRRIKEKLLPAPPRTERLEKAEQECMETDEIRKKIKKGQPIPTEYLGTENCRIVAEHYTRNLKSLLTQIYIVTAPFLIGKEKENEPRILGCIAINTSNVNYQIPAEEFAQKIEQKLAQPVTAATLTAQQLRELTTKDVGQRNVAGEVENINGSIDFATQETMYDYFRYMIRQYPRPNNDIVQKRSMYDISLLEERVKKEMEKR